MVLNELMQFKLTSDRVASLIISGFLLAWSAFEVLGKNALDNVNSPLFYYLIFALGYLSNFLAYTIHLRFAFLLYKLEKICHTHKYAPILLNALAIVIPSLVPAIILIVALLLSPIFGFGHVNYDLVIRGSYFIASLLLWATFSTFTIELQPNYMEEIIKHCTKKAKWEFDFLSEKHEEVVYQLKYLLSESNRELIDRRFMYANSLRSIGVSMLIFSTVHWFVSDLSSSMFLVSFFSLGLSVLIMAEAFSLIEIMFVTLAVLLKKEKLA